MSCEQISEFGGHSNSKGAERRRAVVLDKEEQGTMHKGAGGGKARGATH